MGGVEGDGVDSAGVSGALGAFLVAENASAADGVGLAEGVKGVCVNVFSDNEKGEATAIKPEVLDGLLKRVKTQQDLMGPNGLLTALTKGLVERILEGELTHHL